MRLKEGRPIGWCSFMPKRGEIRVRVTRRMAAATADWLANVYVPPPPGWLSTLTDQERQKGRAKQLATILDKRARWRRSSEEFICVVDRELAAWFGSKYRVAALRRGGMEADNEMGFIRVPLDVLRAMKTFNAAARARRGRVNLSRSELECRVSGQVKNVDERNLKKNKAQLLYERRVDEWHRRGNTCMTGPEPYPQK